MFQGAHVHIWFCVLGCLFDNPSFLTHCAILLVGVRKKLDVKIPSETDYIPAVKACSSEAHLATL